MFRRGLVWLIILAVAALPIAGAAEEAALSVGAKGERVTTVQTRLIELGLLSGNADGVFGEATRRAVMRFQTYCMERMHVDVSRDGTVDDALERYLQDEDFVEGLFDLERGDSGERVEEIQQRLYMWGFLAVSWNGEFGPATEEAVRAFQRLLIERGVPDASVTGVADTVTRRMLLSDAEFVPYAQILTRGDRNDAVERLQNRLIALGYMRGAADGVYGGKTETAIRNFQRGAAMEETGTADLATQALLFSGDARESDIALLRDLKSGDTGAGVRRLQERLIEFGMLDGDADGSYGKATTAAVVLLEKVLTAQEMEGAHEDGRASVAEQEAFFRDDFSVYAGDYAVGETGLGISFVEKRLNALRYIDTAPDDTLDAHASAGLALFQTDAGLPATGAIDRETVAVLGREDAPLAVRALRRDLERGDSGATVAEMETRLSVLGLMDTLPGTAYDAETVQALDRLIEHCDHVNATDLAALLTDGEHASVALQTRLLDDVIPAYVRDVARNQTDEEVARVQRRLSSLYYLSGRAIDGVAGDATVQAITAFQRENGLEETGLADARTQNVLFSDAARTNPMPYLLKVSLDDQRVYVYTRDAAGAYTLSREMTCSTGLRNSTPRGVFVDTWPQERWHYFKKFFCWARYTYVVHLPGDIMFHSVLYKKRNTKTVTWSSVYNLGRKASHGCIRLSVDNAQWIYEHCAKGTPVVIY